ncbi:MAG: hypothetical protein F6K31_13145, partial [Symploca sp. SIO2G7]|nr:hypothetical protein [Symploca sp. SIO2G7]
MTKDKQPMTNYEYQVGGSLPVEAPSYVTRQADTELYEQLKAGEFCYVLNSRQMGKSSLRVQTMQRLEAEGIICAFIDLTGIGKQGVTAENWYAGIVQSLVRRCQLERSFKWRLWWREQRDLLSPVQRLSEFIQEVLLEQVEQPIVVFVDEIDRVLSQNFSLDDFFALIRYFYNQRVDHDKYRRLTFALLGVATPADLIRDKTQTPFNIGRAIELHGFREEEAQPLVGGLEGKVEHPQAVMREILFWTGGQPFLTQKLCKLVVQGWGDGGDKEDEGASIQFSILNSQFSISEIVRSQIIDNWEAQDEPEHLRTIRDRILRNEERAGALLGLYQQILSTCSDEMGCGDAETWKWGDGEAERDIPDSRFPIPNSQFPNNNQVELRLSGLVVRRQGRLVVANRIYQSVFNLNWVEKELTNLRPYAEAFRAWQASGWQDTSRLLRGKALQEALVWAKGKGLSDRDHQFITLSQELQQRQVELTLEAEKEASRILTEANEALTQANRKVKRRLAIGSIILLISLIAATVAGGWAFTANREASDAKSEQKKSKQESQLQLASANLKLKEVNQRAKLAEEKQRNAQNQAQASEKATQQAKKNLDVANKEVGSAQNRAKASEQATQQARENLDAAKQNLKSVSQESEQRIQAADQKVEASEVEAEKAKHIQQQAEIQALEAQRQFEAAQLASKQAKVELEQANEDLRKAREGTKLEVAGLDALRQFESVEIEALLSAVKIGQDLKKLVGLVENESSLQNYPAASPVLALQKILYNINERNQFDARQGSIQSVSFSPNGKQIATAGDDGTVKLWEPSGKQLAEFKGHEGKVQSISFSPDGKQIATAGDDGNVKLWSLSGEELVNIKGHQGTVWSVNFHPGGKQIVTAGDDGTVRLWNLSGKQVAEINGYQGEVWSVSFSPDGQSIVTAGNDGTSENPVGTVRLWNLYGQQLAEFEAYQDKINDVSFSPDGQLLAIASDDGTNELWEFSGGELHKISSELQTIGAVNSLSFSSDGQYLARANNGRIELQDISDFSNNQSKARIGVEASSTRLIFNGHTGLVNSVSFSLDGRYLAIAGYDGTVRVLVIPKKQSSPWVDNQGGNWLSFSPNGQILATAGKGGVQLWELSGQQLAQFAQETKIRSVSFNPNGQSLATVGEDGFVRLWSLSGQQLAQWKGHQDTILWVEFSPDGKYLSTASKDGTARLWNLSGEQVTEFTDHQDEVRTASFSPDGQRLVTGGRGDSIVRIWNLSGQLITKFDSKQGWFRWANFSPDGQYLAIAGNNTLLWNLSTQETVILEGSSSLRSLSFSPDGQYIATGSDTVVQVWDLSGRQLAEFRIPIYESYIHEVGRGNGISFSPDGQRLAAVGVDGEIRIWRLEGLD